MLETSEPESNVEELMLRMREGAARRRIDDSFSQKGEPTPGTELINVGNDGARFNYLASSTNVVRTPLALQPEFEPHANDSYHASDLLKYHDRDFVQNAYRAILKRVPDAAGFKQFIESLRAGQLNKIDVLARLRRSPEGEAKNVRVDGLRRPALVRSLYRLPAVGYLAQLIIGLLRLPSQIRNQQQLESYLIAQQQLIADHFNEAHAQSAAVIDALGHASRRQQLALDELKDHLIAAHQNLETNLAALNSHVDSIFAQLSQHTDSSFAQLSHDTNARFTELAEHNGIRFTQLGDHIEARFAETSAALQQQKEAQHNRLDSLARNLKDEAERVLQKHQETRMELALQARRISLLLEEGRGQLTLAPDKEHVQLPAGEDAHTHDALYISLEDQLRGSRAEIIERLRIYVPLLKAARIGSEEMPVLDIGCGRGEWLELLKAEGLSAVGVDTNSIAIAQCRERGFDAREADALAYMLALPDKSVGAVTGFHLVEHLPFDVLMKLLDETARVVKPGGAVVFETPNPQNVLVGSCNFYFDPTHRNPLPSPLLKFLVESRGFARVEVLNLHPAETVPLAGDSELVKRFNEYFYGPMDYAVTGWKAKA